MQSGTYSHDEQEGTSDMNSLGFVPDDHDLILFRVALEDRIVRLLRLRQDVTPSFTLYERIGGKMVLEQLREFADRGQFPRRIIQ